MQLKDLHTLNEAGCIPKRKRRSDCTRPEKHGFEPVPGEPGMFLAKCPECSRTRKIHHAMVVRIINKQRSGKCVKCTRYQADNVGPNPAGAVPHPPVPLWHYRRSFHVVHNHMDTWSWMETDAIVTISAGGFL